ncbi:V-type ATP synthase subunit F [Candidatus Hodarchaeum mangrovi]
MNNSILIITHPILGIGYRLAGANVFEAENGIDAFNILQTALKDENIGIVGIDEDLYKSLNPRFLEAIKKRQKPLILSMQSVKEGGTSAEEHIREITLRTAGIIVKVEKE